MRITTRPVAVLALAAALAAGAFALAEDKPPAADPPANPDPRMPYFLECARECSTCARSCDLCARHCEDMLAQGLKEHLPTLRACQDCAAICTSAARVVAKNGPFSDLICAACADACKRCGDACAKHPADPIMKQCTDECRRCEKACREMLKNTPKKGKE